MRLPQKLQPLCIENMEPIRATSASINMKRNSFIFLFLLAAFFASYAGDSLSLGPEEDNSGNVKLKVGGIFLLVGIPLAAAGTSSLTYGIITLADEHKSIAQFWKGALFSAFGFGGAVYGYAFSITGGVLRCKGKKKENQRSAQLIINANKIEFVYRF